MIHLRIVDKNNKHLIGWKEFNRNNLLSARLFSIATAKNFTYKNLLYKCMFLYSDGFGPKCNIEDKIEFPAYIQVVKKIKYKNGKVTKNVIYSKEIIKES